MYKQEAEAVNRLSDVLTAAGLGCPSWPCDTLNERSSTMCTQTERLKRIKPTLKKIRPSNQAFVTTVTPPNPAVIKLVMANQAKDFLMGIS